MGLCLDCKELFSYNGALKHCKQLAEKHQVDFSRLFCPEKLDFYKQQILSDVELLWEKWRTKVEGVSNDVISQAFPGGVSEMLCVEDAGLQRDMSHIAEESCTTEQPL